jgi:hypothetical protein
LAHHVHFWHALAELDSTSPAAQVFALHTFWPVAIWYVPAAHAKHEDSPPMRAAPAASFAIAASWFTLVWYVPAAHGVHVHLPATVAVAATQAPAAVPSPQVGVAVSQALLW